MVIFEDARGRTLMRVEDSAKELDLCPLEVNERCVNLAEGLQSLPYLQKLTLRLNNESWPAALGALTDLPRLTDLAILGPAAGVDLSPLATCTSLRALGLFSLYQVNVAPLGNLHNIERLTIDGHVTHIEVVRGLRQLLRMYKTTAKDGDLTVLTKLGSLQEVVLSADYGDRVVEVAHQMPRCFFSLCDTTSRQPWYYIGDVAIYGKITEVRPSPREGWILQDLRPLFSQKSNRAIEEILKNDLKMNDSGVLSKLTFASTDSEFIVRSTTFEVVAGLAKRINKIHPPTKERYRAPSLEGPNRAL